MEFDSHTVSLIAQEGYRPEYGARPVKRAIKEMVVNKLSLALLRQEVSKDSPIKVSANNGQIVISN